MNYTSGVTFESPTTGGLISAVFMSACCLVGLYGNVMSSLIFLHPLMRSPINILLAGLSLIDLSLIMLSGAVMIVPGLNFILKSEHVSYAYGYTSLFVYPLCTAAHTSSIYTFVLVSIERYSAVCTPLKRHKLLTCRQAKLAQTLVVFLALFYNAVRFWEYAPVEVKTGEKRNGSSNIQPYLRTDATYFIAYYTVSYVITHFVLPFSIILILNILVIRSIRYSDRYPNRRAPVIASAQPVDRRRSVFSFIISANGSEEKMLPTGNRNQRKTTTMIVTITSMFAVCNACPFVLNIWEAADMRLFYGPSKTKAYLALDLSNAFVLLNSSLTFVVYLLFCKKYRLLFAYFARLRCCPFSASSKLAYHDLRAESSFRRYSVVPASVADAISTPCIQQTCKMSQKGGKRRRRHSSLPDVTVRKTDSLHRQLMMAHCERKRKDACASPPFRCRLSTQ